MLKNYRYRWFIVPVTGPRHIYIYDGQNSKWFILPIEAETTNAARAFQNTIVYLSTRRIVAYTNGLDEPKSYALENFNPISFKIARSQVTISAFVNDMVVFNGTNGTFQRFRD